MEKQSQTDSHSPIFSEVVDQLYTYDDEAVTDPAELVRLSIPQDQPVGVVDQLVEFDDQAITDPRMLSEIQKNRATDKSEPAA